MSTTDWEGASRAKLFVRSDLPTPAKACRHSTISRLQGLVASGVLEDFSVTSWAKRVPLDAGADIGALERDLYTEFSAWAREAGVRLAPFFDTRECYSWTTGQRQTQLVMPAVCVALYDGDDLVTVTPHADEGGATSIMDCLDHLEDDEEDAEDDRVLTVTAG